MARRQSNTAGSRARRRRVNSTDKRSDRQESIRDYSVDGSVIRELQDESYEIREKSQEVSRQTRKNHGRAKNVGLKYVIALSMLCTLMVMLCINYLQLRSRLITLNESIARKETRLRELQEDNEAEYQKIISSVTMDDVRDTALNKLGMHYATETQIRYYDADDDSYVRQYESVDE